MRGYIGPCPGMPGSEVLQSLATSRFDGAYAWVVQEKGKGNAISIPWIIQGGSYYGGWRFNLKDPLLSPPQGTDPVYYDWLGNPDFIRVIKTPSDISDMLNLGTINNDLLRRHPFFEPGWGSVGLGDRLVDVDTAHFCGPTWIMGLYTTSGGDTIAADPAKNAQLLAEAIPALSTPTGSRFVYKFGSENNYDMPVQFADQSHWPRGNPSDAIPPWNHSDMHDVAYLYLYKLYNQIVSISQQ